MRPLEGTLARLGSLAARLSLTAPPDARAVPADRLARPGPELDQALGIYAATLGADGEVAASQLTKHWATSVARAAVAAYATERRVPDVAATNSALACDGSGRPVSLVLTAPRFAALPGDPDAGCPTAVVVADEARLAGWLREQALDAHLRPAVDAVAAAAPVDPQRLWGNVAAACASAFSTLSGRRLPLDRLRSDAATLLDAPGAATRGLVRLVPMAHGGRARLFVRREVCCLRYRLRHGPPRCLSCPQLSGPELRRRVALRLSQPED